MTYVAVAILAIVAAIVFPRLSFGERLGLKGTRQIEIARGFLVLAAIVAVFETSVIRVPADQVGIVRKLYGFANLPDGRLIATNGETGYQAEVISPGTFRLVPFFNVVNTLEYFPLVTVPQGFYGRVVARDGVPLPAGQIMADAWPEQDYQRFLDAEYFLTHDGQKGLQLSVLKPGVYPLNLALFEVRIGYVKNGKDTVRSNDDIYSLRGFTQEDTPLDTSITRVPAGSVGVVRSSVQGKGIDCTPITAKTDKDGLEADLVPQGCKGNWADSLPPNDYYLNRDAYDVTFVSTRVTALEFKGGFTRRYIDLKVDSKGDFTQSERTQSFPKPSDSADTAINTKIEGWEIQQELRAVVQITQIGRASCRERV